MCRRDMKRFLVALLIAGAGSTFAHAATVTNKDGETVVLVVVEGGNRMDVPIDAGATETICPSGCFVTLPNGDRVGLSGGETVDIVKGSAQVK